MPPTRRHRALAGRPTQVLFLYVWLQLYMSLGYKGLYLTSRKSIAACLSRGIFFITPTANDRRPLSTFFRTHKCEMFFDRGISKLVLAALCLATLRIGAPNRVPFHTMSYVKPLAESVDVLAIYTRNSSILPVDAVGVSVTIAPAIKGCS